MRTFVTVVGGQAYVYCLPRIGAHVESDSGPVFPKDVLLSPIGVPTQGLVGYEVGGSADGVDEIHCRIQQLKAEARLVGGSVHRVLHHGGILHNEQVESHCVYIEGVGDSFRLAALGVGYLVGAPVAEPYAGNGALGYSTQLVACAGVSLIGVEVDGVA